MKRSFIKKQGCLDGPTRVELPQIDLDSYLLPQTRRHAQTYTKCGQSSVGSIEQRPRKTAALPTGLF